MKEADMEELIVRYPELFLEKGLTLLDQQHVLENYRRPDVLFRDAKGRHVLVEIQCGALDEQHAARVLDYVGAYKMANPDKEIRMIFVAQYIAPARKNFLKMFDFEFKEIPLEQFQRVAREKKVAPNRKRRAKKEKERATHAKRGLAIPDNIDRLNYGRLPNMPLFTETAAALVLKRFNDYMMRYVLKNKKQVSIPQHSAWILAHKAGLHVTLAEAGRSNADTRAYFGDQTNRRIEAQMRVFYQKLMKQAYSRLDDIEVTLSGSRTARVLTFKKIR